MKYAYPCRPQPDEIPGAFIITFRDIEEAITQGDSLGEAIENAQEAMELALIGRLEDGEHIPEPSEPQPGEELVPLTPRFAAKTALLLEIQRQDLQPQELQHRMGVTADEVHNLLDPAQISPLHNLTHALQTVGRRLVVEDMPDDAGEHFQKPARLGPMDNTQFIRRLRSYATHRGIQWALLNHPPDDNTVIQFGELTTKFPEGTLSQQNLADITKRLGIDAHVIYST